MEGAKVQALLGNQAGAAVAQKEPAHHASHPLCCRWLSRHARLPHLARDGEPQQHRRDHQERKHRQPAALLAARVGAASWARGHPRSAVRRNCDLGIAPSWGENTDRGRALPCQTQRLGRSTARLPRRRALRIGRLHQWQQDSWFALWSSPWGSACSQPAMSSKFKKAQKKKRWSGAHSARSQGGMRPSGPRRHAPRAPAITSFALLVSYSQSAA